MLTEKEQLEYRKRVLPGYAEFIEIPEEKREAYVLNIVNQAFIKEGLAPLERLATDEEVEAAIKALHAPAKKPSFRQRLRRAWAILWPKDY